MGNELAVTDQDMAVMEKLVVNGDMKALTPEQRVQYYRMRCDSAGLDWRTQPFSYITLQGKLTLYATKTATEQLCEKRKLSCEIVTDGMLGDLYKVQARCTGDDGRHTDNIGVVTAGNLKGDALANAMMKAVTKSFRRAVLSHCGLGMLDETETETIPNAAPVAIEAAHQTIELATQADLDEYEAIRQTAIDAGFLIKGSEPKPATPNIPREKILKGIKVMQKWLDENTPEQSTAEAMGDDGSVPVVQPSNMPKHEPANEDEFDDSDPFSDEPSDTLPLETTATTGTNTAHA